MSINPVREGFHTVTPYLIVQDTPGLIKFVKQAFGATESFRTVGSAGGIHCEVKIGNSMVMIGGGWESGTWSGESSPATLFLYIPEVDTVYENALKAGATSIMQPNDRPEGDRTGGVQDAFGNVWYIATHLEDVSLT